MIVKEELLSQLYFKGRVGFLECISNPENQLLELELDIKLDEILLVEESISITFFQYESSSYHSESRFKLLTPFGTRIGYYRYIEDDSGTPVDDYLVFE